MTTTRTHPANTLLAHLYETASAMQDIAEIFAAPEAQLETNVRDAVITGLVEIRNQTNAALKAVRKL